MSKVFDYESSLKRMGNDPALFLEMVELLRADAPALLDLLRQALLSGDNQTTLRAAHTLKGLASNFGAERATAAACEVEQLAKRQPNAEIVAATQRLTQSFTELIAALPDPPTSPQDVSPSVRSRK